MVIGKNQEDVRSLRNRGVRRDVCSITGKAAAHSNRQEAHTFQKNSSIHQLMRSFLNSLIALFIAG
jgi:hypothetical protein